MFGANQFATLYFGQAFNLLASEDLSASGTITFAATPVLTGRGALSATASLTVSPAADISATGRLSAVGALSFAAAANLRPAEDLSATGALTITGAASLRATGRLSAVGIIVFDSDFTRLEDGNLGTLPPIHNPGSGSNTVRRHVVSESLEYAVRSSTVRRGVRKE